MVFFCYGDSQMPRSAKLVHPTKTRTETKKLLTLNLPSRLLGLPPGENLWTRCIAEQNENCRTKVLVQLYCIGIIIKRIHVKFLNILAEWSVCRWSEDLPFHLRPPPRDLAAILVYQGLIKVSIRI